MKVKVQTVLGCSATLQTFSTTKMKISTAYKVRKIIDECNIVFREAERRRIEALKKLATPDEEGKQYIFPSPENEALFTKQMEDITNEEVEIDVPLITIAELDAVEGIEIEPALTDIIDWFLDKQGENYG